MAWSLFRRGAASSSSDTLPEESFAAIQAVSDGLPDVWIVNVALDDFAQRLAFAWHLSILIGMADVTELGMPSGSEQDVLGQLGETLGRNLKAGGNALLLASITWNGTRQLLYRVRDPEVAHAYLTSVVGDPSPVREMDYRMEEDAAWSLAETYLAPARQAHP